MKARPGGLLLLLVLAPVLTVACGVPISAADLALTPEATATDEPSLVAVSSRSVTAANDPVVRPLTTSAGLTPQATLTTATTGTPGAGPAATLTSLATSTATVSPTPFGTPPPTPTPAPQPADLVAEALAIINKYRTDSGRPPLQVNAALATAAGSYAKLMADNNWFYCGCDFHTGPDGSQPDQRAYRAGYGGHWNGEAIAGGQGTARDAVNTWLNSPPHAAILLNPNSTEVGIGYYYKAGDVFGHYWVLTTGSP